MKKLMALLFALLIASLMSAAFASVLGIADAPYVPERLIGTDDRITIHDPGVFPYSAIGMMVVTAGCECGYWQGTCFMIGPDIAMTAAHCVTCPIHGVPAKKIDILFGYKNPEDYLYHYHAGTEFWYGTNFVDGDDSGLWDYAYMRLNEPVGNTTGYFAMMTPMNSEYDEFGVYKELCSVAGYLDGLKVDTGHVYCDGGLLLEYVMDTEPGNSGGPVFTPNYYVIGIHIQGTERGNVARRLTPELRDNMRNNLGGLQVNLSAQSGG